MRIRGQQGKDATDKPGMAQANDCLVPESQLANTTSEVIP